MIKAHNYHLHRKSGYYVVVNHDLPVCPACHSAMTVKDSYKRKVLDADGQTNYFRLRRLYCSVCGKIHSEIPDCITAHKHYSTDTIQGVIDGKIVYFAGDLSTVYRWRKHT